MSRRSRDSDGGAALVEVALLAPLLILLAFGIVDIGRALYTRVKVQEAAQEGAMYGSFSPGDSSVTVQRVINSLTSPTLLPGEITVDCIGVDPLIPDDVPDIAVGVTHDLDLITPIAGWFGGTITLQSTVTATIFVEEVCDPTP